MGYFLCGDLRHYRRDCPYLKRRDTSPLAPEDDRSMYHVPQDGLEVGASGIVVASMVLGAPLLCLSGI